MTGNASDGMELEVWTWPCDHEVTAPSLFTPCEFCPVCLDSRGPEVADSDVNAGTER